MAGFTFKDLGAINQSIDSFGNAMLDADMRRRQQQQQDFENDLKTKANTRADLSESSMAEYRAGELKNAADANTQRANDAKERIRSATAKLAAQGEDSSLKQISDYFKRADDSLINGVHKPEELSADIKGWVDNASPDFLKIAQKSPYWPTMQRAQKGETIFQKPTGPVIQNIPTPPPGQNAIVSNKGNMQILRGGAEPMTTITQDVGLDGKATSKISTAKFQAQQEYSKLSEQLRGGDRSVLPRMRQLQTILNPEPTSAPAQPFGGIGGNPTGAQDIQGARQRANQAIKNGKDPDAVRQKFKQLYGQDL